MPQNTCWLVDFWGWAHMRPDATLRARGVPSRGATGSCCLGVIIIQLTLEQLQEFYHLILQTACTGTPSPPSCLSEGVGRVSEQPTAHLWVASSTIPDSSGRYYSSPKIEPETLLHLKSSGTTRETGVRKQLIAKIAAYNSLSSVCQYMFCDLT